MAEHASSYFRLSDAVRLANGSRVTGRPRRDPGERLLWRGRAKVAEYLYSETMNRSAVHWALPDSTTVEVTDRRLTFSGPAEARPSRPRTWPLRRDIEAAGELLWQWPYHLYVRSTHEVLLVCGAALAGGRPTLALSDGDVGGGYLANILRRAIAGFRIAHADALGLNAAKTMQLAELLTGPNFQRRTGPVRLPGALLLGFQQEREYQMAAAAVVTESRHR